jgi:hypothetical protein
MSDDASCCPASASGTCACNAHTSGRLRQQAVGASVTTEHDHVLQFRFYELHVLVHALHGGNALSRGVLQQACEYEAAVFAEQQRTGICLAHPAAPAAPAGQELASAGRAAAPLASTAEGAASVDGAPPSAAPARVPRLQRRRTHPQCVGTLPAEQATRKPPQPLLSQMPVNLQDLRRQVRLHQASLTAMTQAPLVNRRFPSFLSGQRSSVQAMARGLIF